MFCSIQSVKLYRVKHMSSMDNKAILLKSKMTLDLANYRLESMVYARAGNSSMLSALFHHLVSINSPLVE